MKLNDVTICAIDCVHPQMAINSIEKSIKHIEFGDVVLFTDKKIKHNKVKSVLIDKVSHMNDYNSFVFKRMHKYIETDYVLIVQWDGWILDPTAWSDEYLQYDYIGAPWTFYDDGMVVGNGGFSLRTKKLLQILTNDEFVNINLQAEDHAICREYRDILEKKHDIKFAPLQLANKFSYESHVPTTSTFGFHGVYNLWRHAGDDEIVEMFKTIRNFSTEKISQQSFFGLLISYFTLKKYCVLKQLYNIMTETHGVNLVGDGIYQITNDKEFTANFIHFCESL